MRINIVINDDTIEQDVIETLESIEEDCGIEFPNEEERNEFINDCVNVIIDKYEFYERYTPDYNDEIYELAKEFGYMK